jgi:hypothetical protein
MLPHCEATEPYKIGLRSYFVMASQRVPTQTLEPKMVSTMVSAKTRTTNAQPKTPSARRTDPTGGRYTSERVR